MNLKDLFKSRATKLQEAKTAALGAQSFYDAVPLWNTYVGLLKEAEKENAVAEIQGDLEAKLYDSRAQLSRYASFSNVSELVPATRLASTVVRRIASSLDKAIAPYCDTTPIIGTSLDRGEKYRQSKECSAIEHAVLKGGVTSTHELFQDDETRFMKETSYATTLLKYADSDAKGALASVVNTYTSVAAQMVTEIAHSIIIGITMFEGAHDRKFDPLFHPTGIASYAWCLLQLRDDVNRKYVDLLTPRSEGAAIPDPARSSLQMMNQKVSGYITRTQPQAQEAIQYWLNGYYQDSPLGKKMRAQNITHVCDAYKLPMPANIPRVENI
jgi:hypothetical protein